MTDFISVLLYFSGPFGTMTELLLVLKIENCLSRCCVVWVLCCIFSNLFRTDTIRMGLQFSHINFGLVVIKNLPGRSWTTFLWWYFYVITLKSIFTKTIFNKKAFNYSCNIHSIIIVNLMIVHTVLLYVCFREKTAILTYIFILNILYFPFL